MSTRLVPGSSLGQITSKDTRQRRSHSEIESPAKSNGTTLTRAPDGPQQTHSSDVFGRCAASRPFEDGVDRGCRDEGFGDRVVSGEVGVDRGGEVGDAVEDAAAERFLGEFAEPAFDEVEPGARGWDEVEVEAGRRLVGDDPRASAGRPVLWPPVHVPRRSEPARGRR